MTPLEQRQVLHPFICQQFGFATMREMLNLIKEYSSETWEINNDMSSYGKAIKMRVSKAPVAEHRLRIYDRNIIEHSRHLHMNVPQRSWKPFQYLALLFTEHYLDRYFSDADSLLHDLNQAGEKKSLRYEPSDLQTIAFQSATGSGKTLILHANIRQYMHYLKKAGQRHRFNKIILVTPDEGMSRQHQSELHESGFEARLFQADRHDLFGHKGNAVEIIDLHKLYEKSGTKRVAVESFEENNLVMVDEGHLGTGGKKWRERRKTLGRNGFTFEYSATFNQAVDKADGLRDAYAKSLIFDYSYKHFYADGYGKDYNIHNLNQDGEASYEYLLACLLQFYQQQCIYDDHKIQWQEYNLAPPLLVFLGNTVTASNRSDVIKVIQFLAWVMDDQHRVTPMIKGLFSGDAALRDQDNAPIFENAFSYIKDKNPHELYDDMMKRIFNGIGKMHLAHCTRADEIHLRAGDADAFGVINVGDTATLYKLLFEQNNGSYETEKDIFSANLFAKVDQTNSSVTTVIGAQKFAVGWNSWRVSTMGLLNVGRNQGSQIIQMFGRGVRLKGKAMTLKRHEGKNDDLSRIETLNIFGVRANYMAEFKKYLDKEGVVTEWQTFSLPVTNGFKNVKDKNLKILRMPNELSFKTSEERINPMDGSHTRKITLNLYDHVESVSSMKESSSPHVTGTNELKTISLAQLLPEMLDAQSLYHDVLQWKLKHGWHNMEINLRDIKCLLQRGDWFMLYAPDNYFQTNDLNGHIVQCQKLMSDLVTLYFKQMWNRNRARWESQEMELIDLSKAHENFIQGYEIAVDKKDEDFTAYVDSSIKKLKIKKCEEYFSRLNLGSLVKSFHGFEPLLYKKGTSDLIRISPEPLNDGEKKFVCALADIASNENNDFDELFLIRNQSRGHGVRFFTEHGNYFPDFILWLIKKNKQHILFIDPKGLVHSSSGMDDKIRLHKNIKKDIEQRLHKNGGNPKNVLLHSYIWSVTKKDVLGNKSFDEFAKEGIYFSEDGGSIQKMLKQAVGVR